MLPHESAARYLDSYSPFCFIACYPWTRQAIGTTQAVSIYASAYVGGSLARERRREHGIGFTVDEHDAVFARGAACFGAAGGESRTIMPTPSAKWSFLRRS